MAEIKVFISSSFYESDDDTSLGDKDNFQLGFNIEKKALKKMFGREGLPTKQRYHDISLDYGRAQDKGAKEKSLESIRESDLVVLFIGTRYGTIREEGKSLTHLEYEEAIKSNKSILIYIFPRDMNHKEYLNTEKFIKDIENANTNAKTYSIVECIEQMYEYKENVLQYKAGKEILYDDIKTRINEYSKDLARIILDDMDEIKDNIIYKVPIGVKELKDNTNENREYTKNLLEKNLPYVSRSKFKQNEECNSAFQTETDIYNKVFNENYDGVLISGEGGIGKTRLMFELGRIAERDGWIVYSIFSEFQDWDTLKLNESKKYCFLFDYVEESIVFRESIRDELSRIYPNIKLKIIANSRTTYSLENNIEASFPGFFEFIFESSSDEIKYMQYVIKNIFEKINIKNFKESFLKSINRPSFAVFLLANKKKNIDDFHDIDEFGKYIGKRLEIDFGTKFSNIDREVFRLLASLPLKEENISEETKESILYTLDDAGWIEYDNEDDIYRNSYNDTILDEILILHMSKFRNDRRLKDELIKIFNYAIDHSKFINAFNALNKIKNKSIINNKQLILKEIFKSKLDNINQIKNTFARSSFMPRIDKLKFMIDHEIIDKESSIFTTLLLSVMKNFDKQNMEEEYEYINKLFKSWMSFSENKKNFDSLLLGSFLIPSYYTFYSNEIDEYDFDINSITLDWIKNYGGHYFADYVMNAYLANKDTKGKTIQKYVQGWLLENMDKSISASFLLQAYLLKEDTEFTDVEDMVKKYLKKEEYKKNYTFVIGPYLSKEDSLESIKIFVEKWLSENENDKSYSFILQQYLAQSKEETTIKWLEENPLNNSFKYVLEEHLQLYGFTRQIELLLIQWLNKNKNEKDIFNSVLKLYFDKGGILSPIELTVRDWLNDNKEEKVFGRVAQVYLSHGGLKVESSVVYWLEKYKDEKEMFAGVIKVYFAKNKLTSKLESIIVKWINSNTDEGRTYSQVAEGYIKMNGNLNLIAKSIDVWLEKNMGKYYRNYLYRCLPTSFFDKEIDCLENHFNKLFSAKKKKIMREQNYKTLEECILKKSFNEYTDKYMYFFVAYHYLKLEKKDIQLEKKLLNDFSKYIIFLSQRKMNLVTSNIYSLYIGLEFHDDKVIKVIKEVYENYLDNINVLTEVDKKQYFIFTIEYFKLKDLKEETMRKIKDLLNNNDNIYTKDLDKIFLMLSQNNIFIDIKVAENILNENSVFLNYYLLHPEAIKKVEIIDRSLKKILQDKNISNTNINNKFKPIIFSYLSSEFASMQGKTIIIDFISRNINYRNIGEVIIVFLISGNTIDSIEKLVITFLKVTEHKNYLLKKIENYKVNENFSKLISLSELINKDISNNIFSN